MAISKVKTKKYEVTSIVFTYLGVAGGFFLISVIFIWIAIGNFRYKSNLHNGLENYARNRRGNVLSYVDAASRIDPSRPWAGELGAKVQVDASSFADALARYQALIDAGHDTASVRCGRGVVYLRLADKAKDAKERESILKQARAEFSAAKGKSTNCPEAAIGLAHADLLAGVKGNNAALIGKAKEQFRKIATSLKTNRLYAASITPDGLVDFYSGLGKAGFNPDAYDADAATAFSACHVLAPAWELPLANYINMEAQRYVSQSFTQKDMAGNKIPIQTLLSDYRNIWTANPSLYPNVKAAWLNLALAVPYAFAKVDDMGTFTNMMHGLTSDQNFTSEVEPLLLQVYVYQIRFMNGELDDQQRKQHADKLAIEIQGVIYKTAMQAEKNKAVKALFLNNLGSVKVFQGKMERNAGARDHTWGEAVKSFKEALAVAPDHYWANRNLAVLSRKMGNAADEGKYYAAAEKAKGTDSATSADFSELKQYLGK